MAERDSANDSVNITRKLVDFSLTLHYDALPPEVVDAAKKGVLDTLGVALAGAAEETTRMIRDAFDTPVGHTQATVLGSSTQAPPVLAALMNGAAAHALDYDDTQHDCGTHISASVLPTALAASEIHHRAGKEFLAAYVAGFEVGCNLGHVAKFGWHLQNHGIHPTGYLGHFGAVAAGAKPMGLNPMQTNCSFGIAASQAAGLIRSLGAMSKPLNAGKAAHNALFSLLLAKQGFSGPEDIFDGDDNIFSVTGGQRDGAEIVRTLGQHYEVMHNTVKVYACAGWRNPILEALIKIAAANDLHPKDVKKIQLRVWSQSMKRPNYPEPRTGLEAKFSAQHAAAVAIADRAGGVAQFTDQRALDPALAELRKRVAIAAGEELQPYQTKVLLQTVDGREFSDFIPAQKGDPRNPLSWDELAAKFRANAAIVLSAEQAARLEAMVHNLEAVADVCELTRLCRPA